MNNTYLFNPFVFKGDLNNSFLAPRGVCLQHERLIVADTGQNRIFIWNSIPSSINQEPDLVLGQSLFSNSGRNSYGNVTASSLQYPSGIWSDGQKIIVADAWNHRVLIWLDMPSRNGQPADVVLGQPNFSSNLPNIQGLGHSPNSRSLYWCYGVYSDGVSLWVADTGNRRVMYYNNIPTVSFVEADAVIGQDSMTEREYNPDNAIWPYSVKVSERGVLAITDTQFYRILLWENHNNAYVNKADVIIGQPDFVQNGQNQFNFFPKSNTLNWCYDVCFQEDCLWVADSGNSRILGYQSIPKENNQSADYVLGQKNFTTGSENMETLITTDHSLYWPFAIDSSLDKLVIADTGNHRILIQDLNFYI